MNVQELLQVEKISQKKKDFFDRFHAEKNRSKIAPIFLAFVFSFGIVGLMNNSSGDFSHMMASIAQISPNEGISYPADLILEWSGGSAKLVFWAQAWAVESVEGIILVNPETNIHLSSDLPAVSLTPLSDGMYRFVITPQEKNIVPGTEIWSLHFEGDWDDSQVTLVDTQFTSGQNRYNLSNIVE